MKLSKRTTTVALCARFLTCLLQSTHELLNPAPQSELRIVHAQFDPRQRETQVVKESQYSYFK